MRNATGKAGERFVETFVEETLHFAYRKVGAPDIGVDGEIEILDQSKTSTGGLLKVQVKTTNDSHSGQRIRIPMEEKHLDYFASLTVPPILAVVSLKDKQIWWKPILDKTHYKGPRRGFSISLHPETDKLTRFSGPVLQMIGERSNAMIAKYLIEEVEADLDDMEDREASGEFDVVTGEIWAQTIHSIERTMKEAKCLLKYERRFTQQIAEIEASFAVANARIDTCKSWFKDHNAVDLLEQRYWGDED
jgi:hypothetical protein